MPFTTGELCIAEKLKRPEKRNGISNADKSTNHARFNGVSQQIQSLRFKLCAQNHRNAIAKEACTKEESSKKAISAF